MAPGSVSIGFILQKMNVHAYNRDIALPEGRMSDMGGGKKDSPWYV